ncbi:hypothetical protein [Bradyrhizobium archetypum]|uniref:Uncharacterized protein n=1 Tax=Bradyrhizobium archetypum TaxID=2721160 RepID=A0A7Y4H6K0_9BRAD|nr:hypothetical protein [Bradyrhizobium archetypum]NOJ48633.1 hypothetical protein [Bradyrhizobium archetypum]
MKLFTGSLAAGLILLAGGAQAQVPGRYTAASDFDAPYAVAPPVVHGPRYAPGPDYVPGPQYGYAPGPGLLPSTEVYSVLRDNGFSPLGIPRLRGFVYTISAIDRSGEDGRLVIDARNGRIIRFVPYRTGDNFYEDQSALRAPPAAPVPQANTEAQVQAVTPAAPFQAAPRPSKPPAQLASRTVPMPKASPIAAKPTPAPVQQATAPAPKPTEVQAAAGPAATGSIPATPAPQIAPTQDMPNVQGLE